MVYQTDHGHLLAHRSLVPHVLAGYECEVSDHLSSRTVLVLMKGVDHLYGEILYEEHSGPSDDRVDHRPGLSANPNVHPVVYLGELQDVALNETTPSRQSTQLCQD